MTCKHLNRQPFSHHSCFHIQKYILDTFMLIWVFAYLCALFALRIWIKPMIFKQCLHKSMNWSGFYVKRHKLRRALWVCAGVYAGGWTGWARGLWTRGSPQVGFSLPVPHRELLFGLERQGHKAVCVGHKYNPQGTWRKNRTDFWLRNTDWGGPAYRGLSLPAAAASLLPVFPHDLSLFDAYYLVNKGIISPKI